MCGKWNDDGMSCALYHNARMHFNPCSFIHLDKLVNFNRILKAGQYGAYTTYYSISTIKCCHWRNFPVKLWTQQTSTQFEYKPSNKATGCIDKLSATLPARATSYAHLIRNKNCKDWKNRELISIIYEPTRIRTVLADTERTSLLHQDETKPRLPWSELMYNLDHNYLQLA